MELDLSWSGIVDQIQHEKIKGADLINTIALQKEDVDKQISDAEIKLQQLNTVRLKLMQGALMVAKHLEIKAPLVVQRKDYIINVSSEDLTIDRNVI